MLTEGRIAAGGLDSVAKEKTYNEYIRSRCLDDVLVIQQILNEKYGYVQQFSSTFMLNFYYQARIVSGFKLQGILDNIDFVDSILNAFGYNDEEKREFIYKNVRIVLGDYKNFRYRLAIFNHFGFLKEVFFEKYRLLNLELDIIHGFNTSNLYSVCMDNQFSNLDEIEEIISRMKQTDLLEHKKNCPYNEESMRSLDAKLIQDLKRLKFKNDLARRRQLRNNDDIN